MLARNCSGCVITLGLVALLLSGCSSGGVGKLVPVEGTVTVGKDKLKTGSVAFKPDAQKGNKSKHEAIGTINPDGTYSLTTLGKPGAPPGWYKVVVHAGEKENPKDEYSPLRSLINTKYNYVESTDLSVEVKEGAPAGAYDLKLTK